MGLVHSSDVVEKHPVTAVIIHLKDGLHCINKVCKALTDGDINPVSGQCSNYRYIREQIVQAQQSLERSEQAASTELKCLDENIEILTEDEGKLEQEMHDTKQTLDNLKTEQTSNEHLLREFEGALELAIANLNSTRDTLQRQENKKENAMSTAIVGLGVTLIPVFGWIAGPGMVTAGAVKFSEALDAIKMAEEEVRKFEFQVESCKGKVSVYESKISQIEQDIRQKYDKVEQINEEIQMVKQQREAVAEFQEKVRRAIHILSALSGKASVAEIHTRRIIVQEPVMKVKMMGLEADGSCCTSVCMVQDQVSKSAVFSCHKDISSSHNLRLGASSQFHCHNFLRN
ncbi:hypothetical protein MHYP_G00306920 [Metynnis hypsauchen]